MKGVKRADVSFSGDVLELVGAMKIVGDLVNRYPPIAAALRAEFAAPSATNGSKRGAHMATPEQRKMMSRRMRQYWKKKKAAQMAAAVK